MKTLSPTIDNFAERVIIDAINIPQSKLLIIVRNRNEMDACRKQIMKSSLPVHRLRCYADVWEVFSLAGGAASIEIAVGMHSYRGRGHNVVIHPSDLSNLEVQLLRNRAILGLPFTMVSTTKPLFSE